MRSARTQARGIIGTVRAGHTSARRLAIADSRTIVRVLFLASAVRADLLTFLHVPHTFDDLARFTETTRPDRLRAWLAVGIELRELAQSNGLYTVRGRRARALAAGDEVLTAHYRSVLDYQAGPYEELLERLRDEPRDGRPDLSENAAVIARVSLAAAPFVIPFLQEVVGELRPRRVLDVGCGTGVYFQALLEADDTVVGDALDLAADVIDICRARMAAAGLAHRAHLHVGDVRSWTGGADDTFELITLLNNIYYFDRDDRAALYESLGTRLAPGGELIIATMMTPGSAASAHLHFMLACQAGTASLPEEGTIERDLERAGFTILETRHLVPTEPFVAIRATLAQGV